jgi:hypothetical protein
LDLYQALKNGRPTVATSGVGPFDSSRINFEHPSVKDAVQRDILYDIHRGDPQRSGIKYIYPEPGAKVRDSSKFSSKPVIEVSAVGDSTVASELVDVMGLIAAPGVEDQPIRTSFKHSDK